MDVDRTIETWRGPLVALLAGWGAPWTDANELAQDALVEAYLGRERFVGDPDDARAFGPWIRGIARNLFTAWRRKRARTSAHELESEALAELAARAHAAGDDGRLDDLRVALARLPEKFRTVLYLFHLEETRVREIAALLELPESTVEGRLYQARAALRDALARTMERSARSPS